MPAALGCCWKKMANAGIEDVNGIPPGMSRATTDHYNGAECPQGEANVQDCTRVLSPVLG